MPRSETESAHSPVVDDDRETAHLVALDLRHAGHRVTHASAAGRS